MHHNAPYCTISKSAKTKKKEREPVGITLFSIGGA
jgi:hypothetical protein